MAYKHDESVLRLVVIDVFVPVDEYTQECQAGDRAAKAFTPTY
jgi:hypothetical protein